MLESSDNGRRDRQDEGADGFVRARLVFVLVWSLALAVMTVCVVAALARPLASEDVRGTLVRALGISELAATPSGRPPRQPELPTGIDLAFDPRLPRPTSDGDRR